MKTSIFYTLLIPPFLLASCNHHVNQGRSGSPLSGNNSGSITVENASNEAVEVQIFSADSNGKRMNRTFPVSQFSLVNSFPNNAHTEPLASGYYEVYVVDVTTRAVVYADSLEYVNSGLTTSIQITSTPAELEVDNLTFEDMSIFIDSNLQTMMYQGALINYLPAAQSGKFIVPSGTHQLDVIQNDTQAKLISKSVTLLAGAVITQQILATDPVIHVVNQLQRQPSPTNGAECVQVFVNKSPVRMNTGNFDVCPGETGVFSIAYGTFSVLVTGSTTSSVYYSEASQRFPQNYTTVIDIH